MIWSKDISIVELVLIFIFSFSYLYYFAKVSRLARKLKVSMRSVGIKFILRTIYFGLLIAAVLGPSFGITEMEARTAGKDVFLCIDLSQSMNVSDVSPSRIEKVKVELSKLAEAFKENRIGMIIFSENSYIQIPLTFDIDVIKLSINKLNTNILKESGTNISSAIELASKKLTEEGNAKDRDKVAIIFTDGEDFGESKELKLQDVNGVNFVFVGVGTEKGGTVKDNYEKAILDQNGIAGISALDQKGLNELAKRLNGKSFLLNDAIDPLGEISNYVDQLKSGVLNEQTVVVANNKFLYFLIPALLLVMIDAIFVVKIFKL